MLYQGYRGISMLGHEEWLEQISQHLHEINSQITNVTQDIENLVVGAADIVNDTNEFRVLSTTRGNADGELYRINQDFRLALKDATDLGHETEIAIDVEYFLSNFGLDLTKIIREGDLRIRTGGFAKIEQADRAIMFTNEASLEEFKATATGELGLLIPLKLTFLGNVYEFNLNINVICLRSQLVDGFVIEGSRGAHIDESMPTDSIERQLRGVADQQLKNQFGQDIPAMPSIDFGQGEPTFYSTDFDANASIYRFFGTFRNRRRSRTARITKVEEWAQLAIKFHSTVFTDMVAKQVREAGAQLGQINFIGDNKFTMTAHASGSMTKKVGCTRFGVVINLTFYLEGHIFSGYGGAIGLSVKQSRNPKVDVRYTPRGLDWLIGWTDKWVERKIRDMVPVVNFNRQFYVNKAHKLSLDLNAERLIIQMALR